MGFFKALMVTFMGQMAQTLTLQLHSACPSPQGTVGGNNPLLKLGLGKLNAAAGSYVGAWGV